MLLANKAVFFHVHKLDNGELVAHAHPFDKSDDTAPFKKHLHSKSELNFYNHIDQLFLLMLLIFAVILIMRKRGLIITSAQQHSAVVELHKKGRAPPAC